MDIEYVHKIELYKYDNIDIIYDEFTDFNDFNDFNDFENGKYLNKNKHKSKLIFANTMKTINGEHILFYVKSNNSKENIFFISPRNIEHQYIKRINKIYNEKHLNKHNKMNVENNKNSESKSENKNENESVNENENESENELLIKTIENNIKNLCSLFYVKINDETKNKYCDLLFEKESKDVLFELCKSNKKYFICYCMISTTRMNQYHYELLKNFTLSVSNEKNKDDINNSTILKRTRTSLNCKKEMLERTSLDKNDCELWNGPPSFHHKYDEISNIPIKFTPKKYEFIKYDNDYETSSKINKFTFGLTKSNIIPWDNKNIILSGGLMYDVLTNRFDNSFCDIDLFLTGPNFDQKIETCKNILENMVENQYSFIVNYELNIISIIEKDIPRKIQLIFVKETEQEIVSSFDFTHLMFYYDGKNVYGTEKSIHQLFNGKKTEINDNYHNYRVIKYYRRGLNFDLWNDERNFFELNLTNRNKLLNEYLDKKYLKSNLNVLYYGEVIDYNGNKKKFKNYNNWTKFNEKMNESKKHFTSLVNNRLSTFHQYIVDFKISQCENILTHLDYSIYTLSARTIYVKCRLLKKILDIGGFLMMNYFIIQEKTLINYIVNKVDTIIKKYKNFFGTEIFLPYKSYNENTMILCSSFRYKPNVVDDHKIMSSDIVVKLDNLNLNDEIECLFDFDFINVYLNDECVFDLIHQKVNPTYTYINFSPMLIF